MSDMRYMKNVHSWGRVVFATGHGDQHIDEEESVRKSEVKKKPFISQRRLYMRNSSGLREAVIVFHAVSYATVSGGVHKIEMGMWSIRVSSGAF